MRKTEGQGQNPETFLYVEGRKKRQSQQRKQREKKAVEGGKQERNAWLPEPSEESISEKKE